MARLEINPDYQPLLAELGLTVPAAFLRLSGVIWCGHPDRHVARVVLETAGGQIPVFLKREHRVRWRDRLASAWAGFGFVSKALREFAVLRRLASLGMGCPEPVAAGEVNGQAFLLIREVEGAVDLRAFLQQPATRQDRCDLAVRLGMALARLHNAGVDHPDLYAKHVLIVPGFGSVGVQFALLDWQRSRCRKRLSWAERWRDLAALEATLAPELAGERERLVFLWAYLAACRPGRGGVPKLAQAARQVRRRSVRLLRQRRIRELRQPPLPTGSQNLIWLDGEALCVTRQFQEEIQDTLPPYLQGVYQQTTRKPSAEVVELPSGSRTGLLIRRRADGLGQWLWSLCWRKQPVSPELRQAGTLFRLERYRVQVPRLLAVGQRQSVPGRLESFLLVEVPEGAVRLSDWWRENCSSSGCRQRWQVLEAVARCLRSIHDADCILGENELLLRWRSAGQVEVVLERVAGMRPARRVNQAMLVKDVRRLRERFASRCTWTDQLRFLLHYLKTSRLTTAARAWICRIVSNKSRRQPSRESPRERGGGSEGCSPSTTIANASLSPNGAECDSQGCSPWSRVAGTLLSPNGAECDSQGCSPWSRVAGTLLSPNGAECDSQGCSPWSRVAGTLLSPNGAECDSQRCNRCTKIPACSGPAQKGRCYQDNFAPSGLIDRGVLLQGLHPWLSHSAPLGLRRLATTFLQGLHPWLSHFAPLGLRRVLATLLQGLHPWLSHFAPLGLRENAGEWLSSAHSTEPRRQPERSPP